MASSFDIHDSNAMETTETMPQERGVSLGERIAALKKILNLVGTNLLMADSSLPPPYSLPCCTSFLTFSEQFSTMLL
jgi:hypothetical protein